MTNKNNKTDKAIILKTHRLKHSPSAVRKCHGEMINPLMLNKRNRCPSFLLLKENLERLFWSGFHLFVVFLSNLFQIKKGSFDLKTVHFKYY